MSKKLEERYTVSDTAYVSAPRAVIVGGTQFYKLDASNALEELFDAEASGVVDYRTAVPYPENLAQYAGQLCYLSFDEKRTPLLKNREYLERIMSSAHGSVLEHVSYSILFFGIDRATTHELIRHRAGTANSQVSQRYVDDEHLRFVMPFEYLQNPTLQARFEKNIDRASEEYRALTEELQTVMPRRPDESKTEYRKRIQSCSREVLPNSTEAPIIVTANIRAWRHMFNMRCSEHADVRIRRPMIAALEQLMKECPNFFFDFEIKDHTDGSKIATCRYNKV